MEKNKDLYEILGIDRNASDNEIKKAYKKLALRYHPDRQGGKSEKEKKEAEEKFKEVSWAYDILSDPHKKQRYDQFGITDEQQSGFSGFNPEDIFRHFSNAFSDDSDDIFGNFFNRGRRQKQEPTQGQSIRLRIGVTIEEIMNGVDKDIEYDIEERCSTCNGTGGEGIEKCPYCHGTGMITETQQYGFSIIQNSHPCQHCGGTGQTIKHKCPSCNGTGMKNKTVKQHIKVSAGFENGYQELIKGAGYQCKNSKYPNGDLLIELIYNVDETKYAIQGKNVFEKIYVPYYDCILGKEIERTLPNNKKVKIKIPEYSVDGTQIISSGNGLKQGWGSAGNYIFIVSVKMPGYIKKEEKELLQKLQKINS